MLALKPLASLKPTKSSNDRGGVVAKPSPGWDGDALSPSLYRGPN